MSRFRAAPRKGHLERVQRIHGYISKMRHGVLRIRTEEPDYSSTPVKEYDWEYTCYREATEELPTDAPKPLGKRVQFTSYVDANLYQDMISGKSVTGILHLANKTLIDQFSKLRLQQKPQLLVRNVQLPRLVLNKSLTFGTPSDT